LPFIVHNLFIETASVNKSNWISLQSDKIHIGQ
jgi:hypothetical protein